MDLGLTLQAEREQSPSRGYSSFWRRLRFVLKERADEAMRLLTGLGERERDEL
jgi:hypothetical protein